MGSKGSIAKSYSKENPMHKKVDSIKAVGGEHSLNK